MAVYAGAMISCPEALGTRQCRMGVSSSSQCGDVVDRGPSRHCCPKGFAQTSAVLLRTSIARPLLSRPATQKSLRKGVTTVNVQGSNNLPEPPDDAQLDTWRAVPSSDIQALQQYAQFIATVDSASGCIEVPPDLPDVVPPSLSESIMIRECYLSMLKKLDALGDSFGVVLNGSSEVGKSAFAVLLLHHLAKKRAKVTYRYHDMFLGDTILYFDFSDLSAIDVKIAFEGSRGWPEIRLLSKDRSIWCIKDGRAPDAEFRGVGCYIVLCSSNVDDYRKFAKGKFCEVWWLPKWLPHEMQECRRLLYPEVPEEAMEKRIARFGMLVRNVLGETRRRSKDLEGCLCANQTIVLSPKPSTTGE